MSKERDLVYSAVVQGVSDPNAIASWSGVPIGRVRTELGRLSDLRKIHKIAGGYYTDSVPLLERMWRKVLVLNETSA